MSPSLWSLKDLFLALQGADILAGSVVWNTVLSVHGIGIAARLAGHAMGGTLGWRPESGRAASFRRRSRAASVPSVGGEQGAEEDNREEEIGVAAHVHRNVACDQCGVAPIVGPRFKCGNCVNFDLCAACEPARQRQHPIAHVFIKIDLPLPVFSRSDAPILPRLLYHGTAVPTHRSVGEAAISDPALANLGFVDTELGTLYSQFCLTASTPAGIDRSAFTAQFVCARHDNELFTRFFDYFDHDGDGLISFREYVEGFSSLFMTAGEASMSLRLARAYRMCDLSGDGSGVAGEHLMRLAVSYVRLCTDMCAWSATRLADQFLDRFDEKLSRPISAMFPETNDPLTTPRVPVKGSMRPRPLSHILADHHAKAARAIAMEAMLFDADGDGVLSLKEFTSWAERTEMLGNWLHVLRSSL